MINYLYTTDIKPYPLSLLEIETFAMNLMSTISSLSSDYDDTFDPPSRLQETPDMDPEMPDQPEIDEIEENEPMEQPDVDPLERPEPDIEEIEHDNVEPEINNL